MAKFVEPTKEVDAIQYTRQPGGTLDDVFKFAAQASRHFREATEAASLDCNNVATYRLFLETDAVGVGDWVVFGAGSDYDHLAVMTDEDFRAKYKPVYSRSTKPFSPW